MGIGTYSMAMVDDVPSKVGNYGISAVDSRSDWRHGECLAIDPIWPDDKA